MNKILLIGFILLINACSESPPTLPELPKNAVILAFGDNFTYGSHLTVTTILAYHSELIGCEVINEGLPREISQAGAQHAIPADLITLPELLSRPEYKSDPIHLNPAGYRKLAEKIRDLLIKTGALAPTRH